MLKGQSPLHSRVALEPHHCERFFSLIPDLACICSSDGHFKYLNRAWEDTLGYCVEELLNTPFHELIHPADRGASAAGFLKRGGHLSRYRCRDGSYRWLEWRTAPDTGEDEIFAIARDVTGRVQAEAELEVKSAQCRESDRVNEELRNSQELFKAVVEGTSDCIYVKDLDGRYLMCNDRVARFYGRTTDELLGRDDFAILPAEVADVLRENDLRVVTSGGELSVQETVPDAAGRNAIFMSTKGPIRDGDGNITGVFGISRDVTDLVQAEASLLASQEQLRLLAVELSLAEERERRRIAAELHDEIGQNLALAKLKLHDDCCEKPSARCANAARELGELIGKSIQEVRTLTFQISPPLLYEVGFEAAVEWLAERFEEKHGLRISVSKDPHPMQLDEELSSTLYHVVRELLVNVVKHAEAKRVAISFRRGGNRIEIVVRDDGKGMPPPGETGDWDKLSGFGLFNIRNRIQHLGGELEIRSHPGGGTRIAINVPLKPEAECDKAGESR